MREFYFIPFYSALKWGALCGIRPNNSNYCFYLRILLTYIGVKRFYSLK